MNRSPQEHPTPRQSVQKKARDLCRRVVTTKLGQKAVRLLDAVGGIAITTTLGAKFVATIFPKARPVLCANCFTDYGLRLDAARVGIQNALPCPNCGSRDAKKLTPFLLEVLASQFFVRGSVRRAMYGSAPRVQFNERRFGTGDYEGETWLRRDVELITKAARIGFFHYGPRFWMLGEVAPLKALCDPQQRDTIIARIIREYPERVLPEGEIVHRLRLNPKNAQSPSEYDSPPDELLGRGRLDSAGLPVLYCAQNIEGCVHECRVSVEDELFLATLKATRDLRLLDLTEVLQEDEHVDEFDSLDIAVHMLFFAPDHSYEISRALAIAVRKAGFDGLLYPSYFSQVRSGAMPFESVYGISVRRFPHAADHAKSGIFTNVGLFGRPVRDADLEVACINRLVLHKAHYDIRFGPAG